MANLTQVAPGGVERPDVALKEDLNAVVQTANDAKAQAKETADFLETRVPVGRTINSLPLDADIVITANDLNAYDKGTIDQKLAALEAGGYNPVKVNGHLLDRDIILSAGDIGAYSSSEVDNKLTNLVPNTRKVNGKPLSGDITIDISDFDVYSKSEVNTKVEGLVAKETKVNGYPLSQDITIKLTDLGGADDLVPRSFRINNKQLQGLSIDLTAEDVNAISKDYVDTSLADYLPLSNLNGLGIAPYTITADSFATKVTGSGFYEYAPGTVTDENGVQQPSSVSDRPTGSSSGRVLILSNAPVKDSNGDITTPSSQDMIAWPNDLEGVYFKKSGQTAWSKFGGEPAKEVPYPNVWAPLNDSLAILAGSAPFDTLTVGNDTLELNSKSVGFTRSSIATYIDTAGILQTAETDEARFERRGLLIEGPSVNALFNSNAFGSWQKTTNTSVSANAGVGPDGLATSASKLKLTAATSGAVTIQGSVRADTFTNGGYLAISVFAKAAEKSLLQFSSPVVSSQFANFDLVNGVASGTATWKSLQKLANGWYRCSMVVQTSNVPAAGSNFDVNLGIPSNMADGTNYTTTGTANQGVLIFGAQAEALPLSSSYFPTGSATPTAARSADNVTMRGAPNWNAGAFTFSAEVSRKWPVMPNAAPRVFDLLSTASSGLDQVYLAISPTSATATIGSAPAGATAYASTIAMLTESQTVGVRLDANNRLTTFSNGLVDAGIQIPYTIGNSAVSLQLGGGDVTGSRGLFGHIRNVRIWHRGLLDAQIKSFQ